MKKQQDILVVDDEPVILAAVARIASDSGWSVACASDARGALDLLERCTYRLIICDIMMPGMDGFEMMAQVRARRMPSQVIMSTGFSTVENAVRALGEGAIDFIPKPFTADELLAAVHRGFRVGELREKANKRNGLRDAPDLPYVPCPPKYFRLGPGAWMASEADGSVLLGVTDFFLRTIDSVSRIVLVSGGEEVYQGMACAGIVDHGELTHHVLAPISGKIIKANETIVQDPRIVEKDPFFRGWFYRIIPSDLEFEMRSLVSCSSDRV